jgi:hypothetical protein
VDVQSIVLGGGEMENLDKTEETAVGWKEEVLDVPSYSVIGMKNFQSGVLAWRGWTWGLLMRAMCQRGWDSCWLGAGGGDCCCSCDYVWDKRWRQWSHGTRWLMRGAGNGGTAVGWKWAMGTVHCCCGYVWDRRW